MPTMAEVRTTLTGPGGPFEVVTDVVDGVEMKVYADRLPHLRAVAELAAARGDDEPFLVYGERRIGFSQFFDLANSVAAGLSESGIGHGDRVAVLSANNPEWCLSFWATVNLGGILVGLNGWWKTDEILYGLQDSGSRVLVADRGRFVRIADQLDDLPDLEAVYLVDADPSEFGGDPRLHRFDELTQHLDAGFPDQPIAEPDPAVIFYTSGTTGRPKGAISTHRNMIANLQNTIYNGVAAAMMAPETGPALGQAVPHHGAVDLTPVPRVGLPLVAGGRHPGRAQDRHPRGQVRARQGAAAHPGRTGHHLGHGAHHGVAGVRVPGSPRLRHRERHQRGLRGLAVGRRAPADGPRDLPQRPQHLERLRPDRVELGGDGDQRSRRGGQAHLRRAPGAGGRHPHRRRRPATRCRRAPPARC